MRAEFSGHLCVICKLAFTTKETGAQHINEKHSDLPKAIRENLKTRKLCDTVCKFCNFRPSVPSGIPKHVRSSHKGLYKENPCHICPKSFVDEEFLYRHMRYRHNQELDSISSRTCHQCKKVFENEEVCRNHVHDNEDHTTTGSEATDANNDVEEDESVEKGHTNSAYCVYTKNRTGYCKICKRAFATRYELHTHMLALHRHKLKLLTCDYCPNRKTGEFVSEFQLQVHMDRIHRKAPTHLDGNNCKLCGKGFASRSGALAHVNRYHLNNSEYRKYESKEKKKYAARPSNLQNAFTSNQLEYRKQIFHRKTSKYLKGKTCTICNKTFELKKYAHTHVYVVHLKKDVSCKICGKAFKDKVNKSHHKKEYHRVVTVDGLTWNDFLNKSACPYCENSDLGDISLIRDHIWTKHKNQLNIDGQSEIVQTEKITSVQKKFHENKLLALCDICGDNFLSEAIMLRHKADTHGPSRPCKFCDKSYPPLELRKHISNKHSKEKTMIKHCHICDFKTKGEDFFDHMRSEHGRTEAPCYVFRPCKNCPKLICNIYYAEHNRNAHAKEATWFDGRIKQEYEEFEEMELYF